jgi:flagellin-like protein
VVLALRLRALSPLLATIILIAIVLSAGLVVYGMLSGWMGTYSSMLRIQPTSVDLVVAGNKALLSVSVKNTGNKPLAGIVVTGYDDNGKPFKLALPPADPGQASGNTLVIPLGVSNIVLDGSGNNNHGTIYGATWIDGKIGKALSFDGVDDYVNRPSVAGLNRSALTFMFWSKQTGLRSFYMHPIGLFAGHRATIYVGPQSYGYAYKFASINGVDYEGLIATLDENWYFIAATFDGTQIKCYLDGTLKVTVSASGSITGGDESLFIAATGSGSSPSSNWFCGLIDEVRIYNRALDGCEVSFSNANPGLPPTRGLVAWYPMDEGTNVPFSFTAGSSYALTITAYSLDGSVATQTLTIRATG